MIDAPICPDCGERPRAQRANGKYGPYCKPCHAARVRDARQQGKYKSSDTKASKKWQAKNEDVYKAGINEAHHRLSARPLDAIEFPDTKQCWDCEEVLPRAAFGLKRQNKDGLFHICKKCRKARYRGYFYKKR